MFRIGEDTTQRVQRALIATGHRNANVEVRKAEFVEAGEAAERHVAFMWSSEHKLYGVCFVIVEGDPEAGYRGHYVGGGNLILWPDQTMGS